jgi:23S rRNA pseudouridine1911/1915/1917 synthase
VENEKPTKIKVEEDMVGQRLDLALTVYEDKSRSHYKRLIDGGIVSINGEVQKKCGYRLKEDDTIEFLDNSESLVVSLVPEKIDLEIIKETEDYLVINKKEGLVVHPSRTTRNGTLMNGVAYYLGLKGVDLTGNERAGLVHRLDKQTSGVLLVAKNDNALWNLSSQFAEKKVRKTYKAVVDGNIIQMFDRKKLPEHVFMIDEFNFKISSWIDRNPKNRKKYAVAKEGKGRYSTTNFTIIKVVTKKDKELSFVEVKPETGRTHQIRVHLSYLGFPIVGDDLYGGSKYKRMMLHAERLRFYDKSGKMIEVKSDLPEDFAKLTND